MCIVQVALRQQVLETVQQSSIFIKPVTLGQIINGHLLIIQALKWIPPGTGSSEAQIIPWEH